MSVPGHYCGNCGAALDGGGKFCAMCGTPVEEPAATAEPALEWALSFPLLTSRFMLWDTLKVLVWSGVLFYSLVAVMAVFADTASHFDWAAFAVIISWILVGLGFMFLAVMLIYFGNRYMVRFSIRRLGVGYESLSRRARVGNRAAIVMGALQGSAGAVGAGLLAASQESGLFGWSELRRVDEHPAERVLSLRNGWRVVVRLYCTPENYADVRAAVLAHLPQGVTWNEDPSRAGRAFRVLAIALGALFATWSGALSPWMTVACLLLVAASMLTGPVRMVLAAIGGAGVCMHAAALLPHLSGWEWYRVVPAAVGLICALALAVQLATSARDSVRGGEA